MKVLKYLIKMNYKLPVLFFLFFIIVSSSQNKTYKVDYKYVINKQTSKKSLIFNQKESFFVNKDSAEKDKEEPEVKQDQDSDFDFTITIKNDYDYIIYKNNRSNRLIFTNKFPFDKTLYKVVDSLPDIKWQIKSEFEKIGNFSCQKAITKFRGRNYSVWFCPDIPTTFGPWKFSGLPGLILEISESTGFFKVMVVSIKEASQLDMNPYRVKLNNIKNIISLKENILRTNKISEDLIARMQSNLPRGAKVVITKSKINVLELCYICNKN